MGGQATRPRQHRDGDPALLPLDQEQHAAGRLGLRQGGRAGRALKGPWMAESRQKLWQKSRGATEPMSRNPPSQLWSGRPDSNRRRPAWEAGILPLNYGRSTPPILLATRGDGAALLDRHLRGLDALVAARLPADPLARAVEVELLVERRGRGVL